MDLLKDFTLMEYLHTGYRILVLLSTERAFSIISKKCDKTQYVIATRSDMVQALSNVGFFGPFVIQTSKEMVVLV